MNAKPTPSTRLCLWIALGASIAAACSGVDGVVTVGVRPTEAVAAVGGATAALPRPASDVPLDRSDGQPVPDGLPEAVAGTGSSVRTMGAGARAPVSTVADAGLAGVAGAGGSLALEEDECGVIPAQPAGNVTSARMSSSGLIEYDVSGSNALVAMRTTLAVPAEPPPSGQIFVWAGIQPKQSGANLQPIGNGALMSLLAWGVSCPMDAPASYTSWWIAPLYSNISTSDPAYSGCHAGKVLLGEPTQFFDVGIHREDTGWASTVVRRDTMEASDFSIDLKEQEQGRAIFALDLRTSNRPTEDLVFTHTVLSMEQPDPDACQPILRGANDFASRARVSADGKHCCIDRIVLRAPRAEPTTVDPP